VKKISILAVLAALGTVPCFAGSVLYWDDGDIASSVLSGGIALAGETAVLATSQADFNTQLAAGGWDAVIFGEQFNHVYSGSAAALTAWLAGGGKLIGDTWLDGGLDTLLDGSENSQNGSTITTTADPIFAGIGATISLSNPGYGVFSQGYNPLAGGTGIGTLSSGGSAVVLGNGGDSYLNGPLNDTYTPLAAGQQLIANELLQLTGTPTPEPGSTTLFGLGVIALGAFRRFRTRQQ
jgi:hypothetical protein